MRKFWRYVSNGRYSVGCTGQTVYLYDEAGNEIKRFKDIQYGYKPMISPDGKCFVVKSTEGRLAVYSLQTLSLLRKFRFSKVDHAQDEGFCFSANGRWLFNIEKHYGEDSPYRYAITAYDTGDFTMVSRLFLEENMSVHQIEWDEETGTYYVLGHCRCLSSSFVAKFGNNSITCMTRITEKESDFYHTYMNLKSMGFTEKAYEWSYIDADLDVLRYAGHTLAKLFRRCSE